MKEIYKKFSRGMVAMLFMGVLSSGSLTVEAAKELPTILFVPQDNRPISSEQTAQVVKERGYEIVMPPEADLGNRNSNANIDAIDKWLESSAKKYKNRIAVIASDTLVYGGLVNSRKHEESEVVLKKNLQEISKLHKNFPDMPIYVYSSIMRTPRNAEASGTEDADYYKEYGALIAAYTKIDGADTSGLSKPYQVLLRQEETKRALQDWQQRRQINLHINEELLKMTQAGDINFLLIGKDDNDEGSATDKEGELLKNQAKALGIDISRVRVIAGIDELGLLLLTRVINEYEGLQPKVYVEYAMGYGPATVPTYSSEAIDSSVSSEIYSTGGRRVFSPKEADLVFLVNTNQSGWTYDANTPVNTEKLRFNSLDFANSISDYIKSGVPVAIGDIAFANGSDNALMKLLEQRKLLDKLYGYAGWNTATNSTGFALSMGILGLNMSKEAREAALLTRYIDDWAYQANVRQDMNMYLELLPGPGDYLTVGPYKQEPVESYGSRRINIFAQDNFPELMKNDEVEISLPWDRIFEGKFKLIKPLDTDSWGFTWNKNKEV